VKTNCNIVDLSSANFFLQRLTNNVGLTFSVGDTTELKYVSVEGDWKAENLDFLG
jgi:hypothetical protein